MMKTQRHATPQRRLLLAVLLLAPAALAEEEHEHGHLDISPAADNGRIIVGGYDDADATFVDDVHVFGYELGESGVPGNETFAADPGVNVRPGSGFTGTAGLRVTGPLLYWSADDAGDDGLFTEDDAAFTTADADTLLNLSFGAQSRQITGDTGTLADLFGSGSHYHFNALLTDTSGSHNDGITYPATGIYLFQAQLVSTDGSLAASDPIVINFNYGADETAHEASIHWAEQALAPEPGSLGLLAAGGLVLLRRRREG